jgi:threonylcarbamoyladenosine tRNA methylthiotransferase MtaB
MKAAIFTLGCRVNQSESELIEGNLKRHGFSFVDLTERPDYCIINTCSVTAKSDYQSRQLIRRAVKTGAKVIVTGCYSQLNAEDIFKINSNIEIAENTNKLNNINKIVGISSCNDLGYYSRSRPHIKVQDGCNYSCSYCIVPLARGKSRSTDPETILKHINNFVESGFHEIVLTGIHLGSYGHDLKPKLKLSNLIKTILNETNIHRIRLSSIEVKEVDAELIELLQSGRICRHIHIPLQSGDDAILRLMNRTYSSREFISTVENILSRVPNICLGVDVIAGFPGEGIMEFSNTKKLIEQLPVSYMHIFPFSPRPKTLAAQMENRVAETEKKRRFNELNELNKLKKISYTSSQIGRTLEIIVEEKHDDTTCLGTSSNYLKILTSACRATKKTCMNIRVTQAEGFVLRGTPIDGP